MIELIGGYCIKSDRKQFIVGRVKKDAEGHSRFKDPRYFSKMPAAVEEALRRLMCEKVADGQITTLQQFLTEAKRLRGEFDKILNTEERRSEQCKTECAESR